ncbi:MAG: hypothetical protein IPG38_18040 [Chitinophagaceae bacterium]|nr:hypothetical protein [Chitinophagaceae bacterium]
MTTHTVKTVFNDHMAFTANINGHDIRMDSTADDGGEEKYCSVSAMFRSFAKLETEIIILD